MITNYQAMLIFLWLFTLHLGVTNTVSEELRVSTRNGETFELDTYVSHQEFFTSMLQLFGRKVQAATRSLLQYSKLESDKMLTNINADQYLFFQLLYSLDSGDVTFTNQLLEQVEESTTSQKPILDDWVRSNIALPLESMYRVIESIVKRESKKLPDTSAKELPPQIPDSVVEEVLLIINKSEVFLESCKRGDIHIVQWFIRVGIDFDLIEPLEVAWKNGKVDVVKVLLRNGALNEYQNPERIKDIANASLMHLASTSGSSPEAIEALLKAGAPINDVDESGSSPLFLAIINNDLAAVDVFIKNGADITIRAKSGNTPLHAAALSGNLEAVKVLLELDASIYENNNLGLTPLDISDQYGIFYILKYLVHNNIRLPNAIISDPIVSPYTFFLSEYGKLIYENSTQQIENYCEMTRLMNGRAARVPFEKDFKTNLLELVIKNKIVFLAQCLINLGGELNTTKKNNETLLFSAVRSGSYDIIRLLLNEGVDVDAKNVNGTAALHVASANGILDIVGLLLKRGADIDAVNHAGYTALHFAAKEGHMGVVNYLIGKKITLEVTKNCYDQRIQETPLHLAAGNAQLHIVKNFVRNGIFDDRKKNETWNTLHAASKAGHTDIVKFLLDKGYDPSLADEDDQTALWWASFGGSVPTLMALLERGADVRTRSKYKSVGYNRFKYDLKSMETPLHIAAKNGHKEVCKILMEKGIDKNAKDALLETPLFNAAQYGHFAVVKYLVERKANKNARSINGTTALHAAAAEGHEDIVEYLFDKGMDIEVQNRYSMTPLYVASMAGRLSSVKQLVGLLADVDALTDTLESPLTAAVRGGHYDVAQFLIDSGANVSVRDSGGNTLLMDAVYRGHADIAILLLKRGPLDLIRSKRNDLKTAMHIAAAKNSLLLELLMLHGAPYDEEDDSGFTPLYFAAIDRNEESIRILLNKYPDIKLDASRRNDHWTILHALALNGETEIMKLLLDKSTKEIDLITKENETALHKAVYCNHYEAAKLLVDRGADVNVRNIKGETPLDIALKNNYTDILKLRLCDCKPSSPLTIII